MLPRRTVVLVNDDFSSRSDERGTDAPRGFEADAAVLDTARAVTAALDRLGVEVSELRVRSLEDVPRALASRSVTTVFNLVESLDNDYGREWEVPATLERLDVRYTGNGPRPLRICRAKDAVRRVLTRHGVRVANGLSVRDARGLTPDRLRGLRFPCFVKPARVDGSIGVDRASVCADLPALATQVERLARHLPGPFLVEEFLPGKEINVSLFPEPQRGHVVATEIDFSGVPPGIPRIVTYDAKWNPNSPEYASRSVPAVLDERLRREIEQVARRTFLALDGSGYGRVDMRLDVTGAPCVIDVNPNNDLHPEAGLSAAARSVGVAYDVLIGAILAHAHEKSRADQTAHPS